MEWSGVVPRQTADGPCRAAGIGTSLATGG